MTVLSDTKTALVGAAATARPGVNGHVDSAEAFVPDQSRAERTTSYDVADFPVPGGREEDWRFTPVDRLVRLFGPSPAEGAPMRSSVDAPPEVEVSELPMNDARVGSAFRPADRAAAVAWSSTPSALHVRVPDDAELDRPVYVRLRGEGGVGTGHTVVDTGRHSRATVVLSHGGSGQYSGNVEIKVGDGADLTFVTLQEWDDDALHLSQHDALVGRDGHLKHIAVTLGGSIVRVCTNARFGGPGASVEALGVYFADAGQHQEHRLFVDHEPANCVSRVTYKGALQGDSAHTVWVGDVLIRASAEGTDTYELNRNLVLTDGARADSVPNLEIETGEIIGAGHASATGRFDDEQLFYLQARGINRDEARRLVVRGFFADVVARIGVPQVQEHLMEAIDAELSLAPLEAGERAVAEVG